MIFKFIVYLVAFSFSLSGLALAQEDSGRGERLRRLKQVIETQRENKAAKVSEESLGAFTEHMRDDAYEGRDMLVYVPARLPPAGQRAVLVALHGGGGNAQFMVDHLKINGVAERNGFIVAYLNGSAATNIGGGKMKAWNAGRGCCGQPYENNIDDIGYISGAVKYLQQKYGIDPARTFGIGHSNGAIMTQTLMCVGHVYTRAASLAGALMAEVETCPAARGRTIFNYHGADDVNLPVAGGYGTKGVTNINFTSQAKSKSMFEKSGGTYILQIFRNTDHQIEHISQASQQLNGMTIGERVARDLGLAP